MLHKFLESLGNILRNPNYFFSFFCLLFQHIFFSFFLSFQAVHRKAIVFKILPHATVSRRLWSNYINWAYQCIFIIDCEENLLKEWPTSNSRPHLLFPALLKNNLLLLLGHFNSFVHILNLFDRSTDTTLLTDIISLFYNSSPLCPFLPQSLFTEGLLYFLIFFQSLLTNLIFPWTFPFKTSHFRLPYISFTVLSCSWFLRYPLT